MKVICLHHRLGGYGSHHFNESRGFIAEFARRRKKFVLLVSAHANPNVVAKLNARAVLDDPTFRMEWSFEERSRRFVAMLHRHVDRLLQRGDLVMITIATQLEAHALTRWLQRLPNRKKPWIVVLFLSDRWNRSGRDEYERQRAEFRELAAAIAELEPDDARRIHFSGATASLAAELGDLLETHVDVAPMVLSYGAFRPVRRASRPRVALLGGTRREKGAYLILDIIRACRLQVDVEFLVHVTDGNLTAAEVAQIAGEPGVTVIRDAMTLEDYEAALADSDLLLFPYEAIPYRQRTSGVFGEAVAFGKPVIVTPGTWMAEQIEACRAAGTIAEEPTPDAIARAIARCVAMLDVLRPAAQAMSAAWRETESLPAFVDFVEAEIARRARSEPPARRWFWPFRSRRREPESSG